MYAQLFRFLTTLTLMTAACMLMAGCKQDQAMAAISQQDVVKLFRERYQAENAGLWFKDMQAHRLVEIKAYRDEITDPIDREQFDASFAEIETSIARGVTEYDKTAAIYNASTDLIVLNIAGNNAPDLAVIKQEKQAMDEAMQNLLIQQQTVQQHLAQITRPVTKSSTIELAIPGLPNVSDTVYAACKAASENLFAYLVKNRELASAEREKRRADSITYLNSLKMKRYHELAL